MRKNLTKLSLAHCLLMLVMFTGLKAQFTSSLYIPPTIDTSHIQLVGDTLYHNFIPSYAGQDSFNNVGTFAYNKLGQTSNTFLGPTLIWRPERYQNISVLNTLGTATTVHWHGAHIPSRWDGGPHQGIEPNQTWYPNFAILENPATMWYHPHYAEHTFSQVEMGLAGIVIIEDTVNDPNYLLLPHTYGVNDIPLIVQDKQFKPITGTSNYQIDTTKSHLTRHMIVNGKIQPFVDVLPHQIRFRILDGSSRNSFELQFRDSTAQEWVPFTVIAADAGYLDTVRVVNDFLIGPGIRTEVVIDFSSRANHDIYLVNSAVIGSKWPGNWVADAPTGPIMKIQVGSTPTPDPVPPIPTILSVRDTFPGHAQLTRVKALGGGSGQIVPNQPFNINGNQFILEHVNDTVMLDSIELWDIYNASTVAHPFHIHDIHFVVMKVDSNGTVLPQSRWPVEYLGPKDNILVPEDYVVTFRTRFTDFATNSFAADSAYMYHCHILTHEDGLYIPGNDHDSVGMMQQFVVVPAALLSKDGAEPKVEAIFYPNPAQDVLHIQATSRYGSEVHIFDLAGRELKVQALSPFDGSADIDITGLPKGLVLVEWRSAKGYLTEKVLLK